MLGVLLDAVLLVLPRLPERVEGPNGRIAKLPPFRLQRQPMLQPVIGEKVSVPDRPERQ